MIAVAAAAVVLAAAAAFAAVVVVAGVSVADVVVDVSTLLRGLCLNNSKRVRYCRNGILKVTC